MPGGNELKKKIKQYQQQIKVPTKKWVLKLIYKCKYFQDGIFVNVHSRIAVLN